MCTVILLHRPGATWPVLIAANRDERLDRAWDPPAAHWPGLIGGRDRLGGGSWMAVNQHGVMAAVLNRVGSLGPEPGKRSRGELPLLALKAGSAAEAAAIMAGWDAAQWRPFNLVLADRHGGHYVEGLGEGRPRVTALPPGLSMVTAYPPNDAASARTARHLPRWRQAPAPDSPDDWGAWPALLADSDGTAAQTLNVPPRHGFGTVSASLLALGLETRWDFAAGPPHQAPFQPVPALSGPPPPPLL
jgi:hypothetical protein